MTQDSVAQTDNKDDQELAKALAGLDTATAPAVDLSFEETPATASPFGTPVPPAPVATPAPAPAPKAPAAPAGDQPLETIKKDALNELRPLVDKLTVPPEEKFDTYLLLLRSTDDTTLIAPAHEAAKAIPDEARRAQALLDVIKEIDFLTNKK